jgi:hypothetical protein
MDSFLAVFLFEKCLAICTQPLLIWAAASHRKTDSGNCEEKEGGRGKRHGSFPLAVSDMCMPGRNW